MIAMISHAQVLQVNFKFTCSHFELEHEANRIADPISQVPGLVWKLWLVNRDSRSAGGIYLFDGAESLRRFVDGPIAAEIVNRPEFHEVSLKVFDLLEKPCRQTRAPVTINQLSDQGDGSGQCSSTPNLLE